MCVRACVFSRTLSYASLLKNRYVTPLLTDYGTTRAKIGYLDEGIPTIRGLEVVRSMFMRWTPPSKACTSTIANHSLAPFSLRLLYVPLASKKSFPPPLRCMSLYSELSLCFETVKQGLRFEGMCVGWRIWNQYY